MGQLDQRRGVSPEPFKLSVPVTHAEPREAIAGRVMRALLALPRSMRIYAPGHQRVQAQMTEVQKLIREAACAGSTPLLLGVSGVQMVVDGVRYETQPEVSNSLAFKLRRRRIRGIELQGDISLAELYSLAGVLATGHKEVAAAGGALALLDRHPHPHIALTFFGGDSDLEEAEGGIAIPAHVASALDETLADPKTLERLTVLRDAPLAGCGEAGEERVIDNLIWEFFARPEWADIAPQEVRRAFLAFLDLIEEASRGEASEQGGATSLKQRAESLKAIFVNVLDGEEATPAPEQPAGCGAYLTEGIDPFVEQLRKEIPNATEGIRSGIEAHDAGENALLILCQLLISSSSERQYAERRSVFMASLTDRRFSSASLARFLRFLATELPAPRYESRDDLVHHLVENTKDEQALVLFLVSMTARPDVARPLLDLFVTRPEPFPLVVRLLETPLLEPFRHVLTEKLVETARARPGPLRVWARKSRSDFFKEDIFEALFHRCPESMGTLCKEILAEGETEDRRILLERLRHDGSEYALRILVMGLSFSDGVDDREIIATIAAFRHPLAEATLREAVHRSNLGAASYDLAEVALEGLYALRTPESRGFVREVVFDRSLLMMHLYRRPLRLAAERVLLSEDVA